ncbi:hypothetical protein BS47DRAFT_1246213, partial [Hydnum rufescens UP504]
SSNRIAFLATTGAFITPDWELREVLLDFSELKGAHTGDNMGNSVYKTLHELEI